MAKRIICESRDARNFCERRAAKDYKPYIDIFGEDHGDPGWTLCNRILEDQNVWQQSENEPVFFSECVNYQTRHGPGCNAVEFWIFKNRVFIEKHGNDYSLEQRKLLVLEEFDRERREFEKLHAKFSGIPTSSQSRSKIPANVRIFVWQRDGGCCVECGSNENLEYDHIIPFAKGGSNTERNLQLLCGNCNRLKSDNIQ